MFLKPKLSHLVLSTGAVVFLIVVLNCHYLTQIGESTTQTEGILEKKVDIERQIQQRLQRVQDVCRKYGIHPEAKFSQYKITHPPAPQYSVFYFDNQHHLAYCPLYKSASTSLLHWLLRLKGVPEDVVGNSKQQISEITRQYYPSYDYPAADKMLQDSKRLLIVRHPLERLLSAYRDKLENASIGHEHGTWHYYEKYGKSIVAKYRKDSNPRMEPTFEEFVNYIIETNLNLYADDHWIPYYLFCTPCLVNYDMIAKFESLDDDMRLFIERAELKQWGIPSLKHVTHGGKSKEKLASYFKTLRKETLTKLYEKFKFDFELFDYNIDELLTYVTD